MPEKAKTRILIADDEPSMRLTLADILTDNGFEVATAEDGNSAVAMCENDDYDVVLMDVRMPGINGVEAFKQIRRKSESIRVILMSAYGDEDIKHESIKEGAIAFLDKPLNLETVIQLICESSGLSILAVTSDNELANLLPLCLKPGNQKLRVVGTASEALKLVRQLNFDVALIDAELPEMSSLDCYLAIREVNATVTAVIISPSNQNLLEAAEEAVRRTAYTIMTKPINPDAFMEIINKLGAQRLSGSIRKPSNDS